MSAKWITVGEPSQKTSLYIFKKSFNISGKVTAFPLRISADTRYKLYINGKECAQARFR